MNAPTSQPRPATVILGEALDELRERETRLQRFGDELAEVRAAIKVLEKAMPSSNPHPTANNPSGTTKAAIIEAVRTSIEPLTMEQIAAKIGQTIAIRTWESSQ